VNEARLAEIEARCEAATARPWINGETSSGYRSIYAAIVSPETPRPLVTQLRGQNRKPDAAFIAHARSDVPELVREVRRLREFYEAWREVQNGIIDFDLHNEAVDRLEAAEQAILHPDPGERA